MFSSQSPATAVRVVGGGEERPPSSTHRGRRGRRRSRLLKQIRFLSSPSSFLTDEIGIDSTLEMEIKDSDWFIFLYIMHLFFYILCIRYTKSALVPLSFYTRQISDACNVS